MQSSVCIACKRGTTQQTHLTSAQKTRLAWTESENHNNNWSFKQGDVLKIEWNEFKYN